jgi:hypothetical protein
VEVEIVLHHRAVLLDTFSEVGHDSELRVELGLCLVNQPFDLSNLNDLERLGT